MTTFRDIVGNEVGENGQPGHPPIADDENRLDQPAADLPVSQALIPYDASNSVIWLDSAPIEVTLPGFRSANRTNWTARLVGTGMVAATVASGMLLADSLHNQPLTEKKDNSLANAPTPQPKTAVGQTPQPPIASPENLPIDELGGDTAVASELPLKPGTLQSRLPNLLKKQTKLPHQLAKAEVPGTPRFSINANFKLGQPILRSVQDLPSVAVNQTPPAPEPLAPPADVLATLPPPPPMVQPMPVAPAATSPTVGLQPDATPAAPDPAAVPTTPTPGGAPPPASTTTPLPTTEPDVQWVTTTPAKGSDQPNSTAVPPSAALPEVGAPAPLAVALQAVTTAAQVATQPTLSLQLTPSTTVPQSIQDFVQLQQPSTWLPLTRQAASEALATNQINQFRVFRIKLLDYQNIWRKSNQGLKELPPVHGFVDYRQQVIIVPQSAADVTTQPTPAPMTQSSAGQGLTPPAVVMPAASNQPTEKQANAKHQLVSSDQPPVSVSN
jgi:hypothetical protein